MEVKATAFMARRAMLVAEFGEPRFQELLAAIGAKYPVFSAPILATSMIDVQAFLAFNDAIVEMFYGGDIQSYWRFGERSATWAMTQGPYKHLAGTKSVREFAESATTIYRNYFKEGSAESVVGERTAHLLISGIARPYRHVYFEYSIAGYFGRGLELVGARGLRISKKEGFTSGDAQCLYLFEWDD